MDIQQNLAAVLRTIMETRNKTLEEFAEELEISRSMLQEYLKGTGNPSIKTIHHLSKKLGVEPAVLLTGPKKPEPQDKLVPLLNTVPKVAELRADKKARFAALFMEMTTLLDDDNESSAAQGYANK